MEERYALRITRYRGEDSYEKIVDFLARLYPGRARDELAAGLALTVTAAATTTCNQQAGNNTCQGVHRHVRAK